MPSRGSRNRNAAPLRGRTWSRDRIVAWTLFFIVGVPLGVMTLLGVLASAGIYVEPLRRFWQPWPPDIVKSLLGVVAFSATLAYVAYRAGRRAGYRSGNARAEAAARNARAGLGPDTEEAPDVVALADELLTVQGGFSVVPGRRTSPPNGRGSG